MEDMEKLKIATIADLMSQKARERNLTEEITPDRVVKLPDNGNKGFMGIPRWDVYAARVEEFVCLAHVHVDGNVNVFIY